MCGQGQRVLQGPGGVRRGPEQLQEPQPGWQMSPELPHGAGSRMGRDTGVQQKPCTHRCRREGRKNQTNK